MTGSIDVIRTGARITLRLNNEAKRNSVDLPMLQALQLAALRIANDDSVKLVVLRGAGSKAFCAGADFDAVTKPPIAQSVAALDDALHQAVTALAEIPVPLIAAIEGACFGGGVQLALCADFRIANAKAKFGIPAAQIGMAYPIAAIARIVRYAGAGAASKMILTGESFSAQDALRHRLIDEVVTGTASQLTESTTDDTGSAQPSDFEQRLDTLAHTVTGYDRASAIAYKAMIRALDKGNVADAQHAHVTLANAALYLPRLEAILAERKLNKSPGSGQASTPPTATPTSTPTSTSTPTPTPTNAVQRSAKS